MPKRKRNDDSTYASNKKYRKNYRRKKSKYYKLTNKGRMARMIKSVMLKNCETKVKHMEMCINQRIEHNELTMLDNNLLELSQGSGHDKREGDCIYLKGVMLKFYIENQQYRPFARYKIVVFRNKNNPSSAATTGVTYLWEGTTTSKNLDWFDKNKFDFKVIKNVTVSAPNSGTSRALSADAAPNGVAWVEHSGSSYEVIGNPSKYFNIWIPFNSNIMYEDGASLPSTQVWQVGIIGYSSYGSTTSDSVYPTGHVTCVGKLYFKDP